MKRIIFLSALIGFLAFSVFAQDKKSASDFSGKWELDTTKSKLDERMRIESMTMTVTQSEKDIKVETSTKRSVAPEGQNAPPPPSGNGGMRGGGFGGGMRGGFGGGDMTMTYTLDGKETTVQQETPRGTIPVTLKGKIEGGKLKISASRTFNGPMGEVTMTSKETWELTDGGKGLKVTRESDSPQGTRTTEMFFTKK